VDGDAAHGVNQRKAAGAWGTAAERGNWESGTDGAHRDGGPDESVDGGIISEDAEESLITTTAWLGGALLEGVESGEPVSWWGDDRRGGAGGESRWGGEESNEIVCDEVPVGVGDGELSWAGGGGIDDSGEVDVECGETLGTGNEEAVSGEDCEWAFVSIGIRWYRQKKVEAGLTLDQSKGAVGPDETIFSLESDGNSSHAGIGESAFLFILESDLSRHVEI
jgi:hypothetical protein